MGEKKNLTLFVLAVALVSALVLGTGTASATQLTCGASLCAKDTTVHAASEGKIIFDWPFGNVECESTMHGLLENVGSSTTTAGGNNGALSFTNCGADTVHVLKAGSLEVHAQAGSANGTLTWTGAEVTQVHLGFHCIFGTDNTDIGTLTTSAVTGGKATLDISATLPRVGGSSGFFCGATMPLTGSYVFEAPNPLNVH